MIFHDFQKEALSALEKPDSHILCIAPTGSGKSLIYEQAACNPHRRTLLVTPLVALARQQYQKLKSMGIPVHLGAGGNAQGPPVGHGAWIVSPELLKFPSRRHALNAWKPNFLVVDECHCLWEWGEQFRPAFQMIPGLIRESEISQSLWLTATLPQEARLQLRSLIKKPLIELGTFELPSSLSLWVQKVPWQDRLEQTVHWVESFQEPGMIFVPTREATQRVARLVASLGKSVIAYHGGLSQEERKNLEAHVTSSSVVVATSAFGMGMDYSHLTYVVLWQMPLSLLSLVQIAGRVGRSSAQGKALVFWDEEDFRLMQWSIVSEKRKQEVSDLVEFVSFAGCRRWFLKRYFGDPSPQKCQEFQAPCDACWQG